jgi:hypothetical protein
MTTHYFPEANEPALQPFTQAFVSMMFAHAAFERRVSDLMGIITGVVDFGERPENQWKADDRPKRMKRLIREHRPDGLPETQTIVVCLKRSISFCRDRNLLAHGSWWEFDIDANTITVRSGIARRPRSRAWELSERRRGAAVTGDARRSPDPAPHLKAHYRSGLRHECI